MQWRRPVGNLHHQGLREIWGSSAGLAEGRDLTVRVKEGLDARGEGSRLFNFCPGSAAAYSGSPLDLYPAAVQRRDVEEYSISEGWIKVQIGKKVDRKGNPLTLMMRGKVEPYFRTEPPPS